MGENIPTIPAPPNPFEEREDAARVSAISIPKSENEPNEDSIFELMDPDGNGGTFLVADGLGGYPGGEVASSIVRDVTAKANTHFRLIQKARQEGKDVGVGMRKELALMKQLVRAIQTEVSKQRDLNPEHMLMASTGVIVRTIRTKDGRWEAVGANVGDSRALIQYPDGRLEPITMDSHPLMHDLRHTRLIDREGAMHVQDVLDRLDSSRQFVRLLSLLEHQNTWPDDAPVLPEEVEFLRDMVGEKLVHEYFEGSDEPEPRKTTSYYRNMVVNSFGYRPDADYFHVLLPEGGRLILVSDGVEGLTREEQEACLNVDRGEMFAVDPILMYEAAKGTNPAERLAFGALARADYVSPSPRSKGRDDISVIVMEIPKRAENG